MSFDFYHDPDDNLVPVGDYHVGAECGECFNSIDRCEGGRLYSFNGDNICKQCLNDAIGAHKLTRLGQCDFCGEVGLVFPWQGFTFCFECFVDELDRERETTVLNADATEYVKELDREKFDLIVLDPNYNDWDKLIDSGFINECLRLLRDDGNLLLFTKQPFDFNLRVAVDDIFRREIVWTFTNGGAWSSKKLPLISYQKIYWCVKSKDAFFNPRTGLDYKETTRDHNRKNRVFGDYRQDGRRFTKSDEGVWLRDHLHFNKPNSGKLPAKPSELIEVLLKCFCKPGGYIFDPFGGSGVIAMEAIKQGKKSLTLEIDRERYKAIKDKLLNGGQ